MPGLSIRGGCTPGNSRLGAVSCAHACTNRWRACAAGVISQANMPHGRAGQFAGVAPRAIRAYGRQATLAPVQEDSARARGLHPRQFAPMGGKLRLRLCKRIAHVRGGCTPGNSRLGAVSCAHACTNRWRTCAAGVSSGQRSLGANSRGAGPPVAKSKKRKGRGKRHWPSLFSLRGIIEEGRTCISRKGAVHFF